MKSCEQQARDMLERMGFEGAQQMSAGDLVELANIINDAHKPTEDDAGQMLKTMVLRNKWCKAG